MRIVLCYFAPKLDWAQNIISLLLEIIDLNYRLVGKKQQKKMFFSKWPWSSYSYVSSILSVSKIFRKNNISDPHDIRTYVYVSWG